MTLVSSPSPQTSCGEADALKAVGAPDKTESSCVDSLPDFNVALNAEVFLY